jgi:hypothetical protein
MHVELELVVGDQYFCGRKGKSSYSSHRELVGTYLEETLSDFKHFLSSDGILACLIAHALGR